MQRWHGVVGAGDDGVVAAYRVTLTGVALDADDDARIHARLADAEGRAQQVHDAVALGLRIGAGQLWRPDRGARVAVVQTESDGDPAHVARLVLAIDTTLGHAALALRLAQLFADDRLIEAAIEPLE